MPLAVCHIKNEKIRHQVLYNRSYFVAQRRQKCCLMATFCASFCNSEKLRNIKNQTLNRTKAFSCVFGMIIAFSLNNREITSRNPQQALPYFSKKRNLMKKILLINHDQQFIGDLQTKLAHRYEILATDNFQIAYQLCLKLEILLLLARLPPMNSVHQKNQLTRFLKKLNRKKFSHITKVLTVSKDSNCEVEKYLKLGIAAVIVDVEEVARWVK